MLVGVETLVQLEKSPTKLPIDPIIASREVVVIEYNAEFGDMEGLLYLKHNCVDLRKL